MKDNFSKQAGLYAQFRPGYPKPLFDWLLKHVPEKKSALDSGTGNGQVASVLGEYFEEVWAIDISQKQLDHAIPGKNIHYKVEPAEKTGFADNQFDLLTVAQAIHWYQFEDFYREAGRILKPDGILAVIGYGILKMEGQADAILKKFYKEVIGPYWDPERKYIDEGYQTIPFPFPELKAPQFYSVYDWNLGQLLGYVKTWSACGHYMEKNSHDPVPDLETELKLHWGEPEFKTISFPILLRVGINRK